MQVKYRAAVDGVVSLQLKSAWADRHGSHTVRIDKLAIDVVCIYCPDTKVCYYIDPLDFDFYIHLRVLPPRNNQVKNVRLASNFTEIPERLRGVPDAVERG